jgi:hypothetical protein
MRPSPLVLYLYSNKNIAGCVLALAALGAYFAGLIHNFWPEIVAGAYGVGALATPGPPQVDAGTLESSLSPDEVARSLSDFVAKIGKLLPDDVFALVQSIVGSILGILPLLIGTRGITDQDSYTIRQTALHYLPETINAYLQLPPAFRALQPVADGKNAKQLLLEQLTVLDGKMKEIAQNLVANNAQALLANGQFLRDRFSKQSFLRPVS